MEFPDNLLLLFHISCDHHPSFFVPFASKFLEFVHISPFMYCRPLLFVEWFFNDEASDEQRVWKYRDIFVVVGSLVIVRIS